MKIVIIGGSDAGISAGLRAREIDPESDVSILLKDGYPNFSICGLPFYVSGEIPNWRSLAHRNMDHLLESGMCFMLHHEVTDINTQQQTIAATNKSGQEVVIAYNKLLITTGATSVLPDLPGRDLPGVFCLRFMNDGFAISEYLNTHQVKRAAIIGSGYIGMEMAEALHRRGISVTMIEMAPSVMPSLDIEFGDMLQEMLQSKCIRVLTETKVSSIEKNGETLIVHSGNEKISEADFILIAAGALPCTDLAVKAGIKTGTTNAIAVNEKMETNIQEVFAAGDCVETFHRLINAYTYMPLGTTAHKQGRIAGENACGGNAEFKGAVGTQSLKIFDRVATRTGFRDFEARAHGFDPATIDTEAPDHKAYYPGAKPVCIRLTGDRKTGRLLGAQMFGHHGSEVSKRIDIIAAALFSELTISDLVNLDLSYTPPLSSPWDPIQMAAFKWLKHCKF